jgi:hypothetical protein
MKKILLVKSGLLLITTLLLSACSSSYTPEEESRLKREITRLSGERSELVQDVRTLQGQYDILKNEVSVYQTEKKIYDSGKTPVYILTLHFQEHKMELSFDRISFSFDVPVDEQFYKESKTGTQLGNGSRSFKLFHSGDITIKNKRIEYR